MYVGLEFVWGNFYRYLVKAGLLPIPSTPLVVANLAALKALTTRPDIVITEGYTAANDGGGGPPWQWVAGSSATADDFMVATPTGAPAGRYIRQLQDGGAVNPKWGGCGLGSTDDSIQFQKVINFGAPIDGADGTYPIDALLVQQTSTVPSIINCNFTPAATATTASRLLRIDKTSDLVLRKLTFVSPISTNPTVQPIVDLALFFNTSATISRVWIEDCKFTGGNDGMNFTGDYFSIFVQNCLFESTWRGGSTIASAHYVSYIGCQFITCGISDGTGAGASLAAALRIGSSTEPTTPELYEVIGCTFKDCCVNLAQESLDMSGNAAKNVVVNNNNYSSTGGNGFLEAKCGLAGATSGDNVYRRFTIVGNNVNLPGAASIAFNLHTTDVTLTPAGKLSQVLIASNQVTADVMPASSLGNPAVIVNGWNDVSIIGNKFWNLGRGIELDGYGVDTDTITRISILSNDVYVFANAIFTSSTGVLSSIIDDLVIVGNSLRAVQVVGTFGAATGSQVISMTMSRNEIVSDTTSGLDIRNVTAATISFNTFDTNTTCATCQGATPGTINFKDNLLRSATTSALTLTTGTAITVTDNTVEVPAASRTWTGAATVTAANNIRGTSQIRPTLAGAQSDVVLNWSASIGGTKEWVCTTAGVSGTAYWSTNGQLNGLQRVTSYLNADVTLNNTANFFDGPNTGSIGAAGQVWQIMAMAQVTDSVAATANFVAQIHDGTNALAGGFVMVPIAGLNGGQIVCSTIATLSGPTTFTLKAKDQTATTGSLVGSAGGGVNCTYISAVRLA